MSDDELQGHLGRQRRRLTATETDFDVVRQRAVLVGVATDDAWADEAEESLDELALLTETAGAEPVERVLQRRDSPDPGTYLGKGKLREVADLVVALDADVVVFDDELTPAQQRNLERTLKVDVVDRVALILDIFALHASSRSGMIQVELAQLRYRLPRLRGRGVEMSRLAGGIGTRGPGESQLEVDRRRIQRRIQKLERELSSLDRTRATQRKARERAGLPVVALVGYTNAGKSTLLNRLTDAGVLVAHQLFTTLDPKVKRLRLPGGDDVVVADTVGFVKKLPHQLVNAFRSTLEEVGGADVLLHVVDGSASDVEGRITAVRDVLAEIDAGSIPRLFVVNKLDVAPPGAVAEVARLQEHVVGVSAVTGEGVDKLLEALAGLLRSAFAVVELSVPYGRGDVVAAVHREGEVLAEEHGPEHVRLRARLPEATAARLAEFAVEGSPR